MPKLELGDLEGVARHKDANIPVLAKYAREGYAILSAIPSLHADVQAGTAADVPGRCRRASGAGGDVRPVRVPGGAPPDGLLKTDFKARARQGQLPRALPRPRAEDRPEDRGDVQADRPDGGGAAQHRRALLGPCRHLRREDGDPPDRDEDRQAGVQGDGQGRRPTSSAPTARSPATTSRRAWPTNAVPARRSCAIR